MRLGEAERPRKTPFSLPYEGLWPHHLRPGQSQPGRSKGRVRNGEQREMERALRLQAEELEAAKLRQVRVRAARPLYDRIVRSIVDGSLSRVVYVTSDGDVLLDNHGVHAFAPFQFTVVEL